MTDDHDEERLRGATSAWLVAIEAAIRGDADADVPAEPTQRAVLAIEIFLGRESPDPQAVRYPKR